ncbi:hypothetical protein EG328_011911 [Venturia inaequalis]|uniref:Fork-head domain-containing protein n=1 Tax=Venturia inaequalis TaxID=5025 RepID=A0A8H3Z0F4_VENIN|nr:hypothetical protein EG328_011911 [Venturia inaequalis]
MNDVESGSGGTTRDETVPDGYTVETEASQATTYIERPSLHHPLAKADMKSEPLAGLERSLSLDTEDMAVDRVDKPTLGGDDFQMITATNSSNQQNMPGRITGENEKIEDKAVGTEAHDGIEAPDAKKTIIEGATEFGVSGISDGFDEDLDMSEAAGDERKTDHSASVQPEIEDHASDVVEPREAGDLVEATEKTQSEVIETLVDSPTEEGTTEPSEDDKMDVDTPTTKQEEVEEELEPTDSKTWSLPSITDDGNEPPLSLKQLVIMALVISPTRTLSLEEICQWINDGFKYYKNLTFQHTLHPGTTYNWMGELNDILHRYDFVTEPVLQQPNEDGNGVIRNGKVVLHLPPGREWHILPNPGKMKDKPFRFLDLPLDLRLMILEFALVRPLPKKRGWIIDPEYTAKRKENYRKSRRTPQRLRAVGPYGWELRTEGLDVVLAVLSVSKQVYVEAAPVFYRGNFLEFDSAVTLGRFLDGVPFRRKMMILEWIRNLVLYYDPPIHAHGCTHAFTLLRETKLRNLHLYLHEDKLIKRHELTRFSDPIPRLPGMKVLAEVRGLKTLGIHGPHVRALKLLGKMMDWKKNDTPDDDEQMVSRRKREQKKFSLALERSFNEVRNAKHKKAAEALKKKHTREKEVQKRKRDEERKVKAEEVMKEKKEKMEAREVKRKEREEAKAKGDQAKASMKVHKTDKKKIKVIRAKKNGGKAEKPADEDSSSEEGESESEEEQEQEEPESEESESEEEETSPPPPKRTKTIEATAKLAAAKRNARKASANRGKIVGGRTSKIPIKPAPAPRPLVTKSATGVRSVTTKNGITAKGSSSGGPKKTMPAVKKTAVKKFATGSMKKSTGGKRTSDMSSVFEKDSERVVEDGD